eukprot:2205800-Prymnesium_polylepis.1
MAVVARVAFLLVLLPAGEALRAVVSRRAVLSTAPAALAFGHLRPANAIRETGYAANREAYACRGTDDCLNEGAGRRLADTPLGDPA